MANSAFDTTGYSIVKGVILQVLSVTKTDTFNSASAAYIDIPGLSVTITPQSNTSKIFVMYTCLGTTNNGNGGCIQLVRDAVPICIGDAAGSRILCSSTLLRFLASNEYLTSSSNNYLDSPATTIDVTYKLQLISQGGDTVYINQTSTDAPTPPYCRGASTITVMEVSG